MALAVPNPPNDRKRVKVYELKNNDWFDRGTGFCTGQVVQNEPKVFVESEDQPDRMLLETRITKDDGYQKQQDTLIVWTETNGVDMALSFQEADGCAAIWEFVSQVQQQLIALAGPDDALSDEVDSFQNPVMLPSPELGNLAEIEQMMRTASMSQPGRDSLSKMVINDDYIPKLIPLVSTAEDLESLPDLHRLCNIMKTLILLNDTAIIEYVVTDDVVLGIVGALEYDPDFPSHKANHRQYLSDESKFKEVVPIEDLNIKKKIHHTYRLQYLKDVVLARILDDPTFSVLNSLIFFNQVDIVTHLQANATFLKELFGVFGPQEPDQQRKKNAVQFIQQCCAIAKNLQAPMRSNLYNNFIHGGLFQVINFALRHRDASVRIAGTDVLVAMIDHDPSMMRSFILKQLTEKQTPLTDTLIELLLVEVDLGVKAQIADAIKVLLDPQSNPQTEGVAKNFYDDSAKKLFKPLRDLQDRDSLGDLTIHEVSLFSHLVEILCFFMRQHQYRSKYFILAENLASRVAQLLSCPEKHLKLTALKFFRTAVGLQDEFYNRQIMTNHLFEPILQIVHETMPRDNLLNSACLELFEFIKRENIKPLVVYFVEKYRDDIKDIDYVDTFQTLILKYEQFQGYSAEAEQVANSQEEEPMATRTQVNGNRRWQGVKDLDAQEEEYFNTSDDEDEASAAAISPTLPPTPPIGNGTSSPNLTSLVDYPADDDEDGDANVMDTKESSEHVTSSSPPSGITTPPSSEDSAVKPPERIAEKRRRVEEDDDELGKLSSASKRRSGSAGVMPVGGILDKSTVLRKKKSFTTVTSKDATSHTTGPGKKIAISLAVKKSPSTDDADHTKQEAEEVTPGGT